MPLFDTDAIVLRHYELGEADKIIVLFTKERGKIRVVAKGVRKTKSTLAAGLEPFTYN
ncbi:MAG: DNA repair protein RecO, partial [Halanaerobacter sp.]